MDGVEPPMMEHARPMFDQKTIHVAFLLLSRTATAIGPRSQPRSTISWPGLEIDVLSDALELAGRLLDGSAVTRWGVA